MAARPAKLSINLSTKGIKQPSWNGLSNVQLNAFFPSICSYRSYSQNTTIPSSDSFSKKLERKTQHKSPSFPLNQYQVRQFAERVQSQPKGSFVLLPGNVELSKLKYEEVRKNASGATYIPLSYDSEPGRPKTLKVQTPIARVPFGVTKFEGEKDRSSTLKLSISLDEIDTNPDMKKFYELIHKFDEKMISFALKEAKNWFKLGKPITPDVIRFNYKPSLRPPKDQKYSHTMGLKIPTFADGKVSLDVYHNQEHVPLDIIKSNAKIVAIIEPRSIYFIGGNWGVTWAALQVKVEDPGVETKRGSGALSDYAFIE